MFDLNTLWFILIAILWTGEPVHSRTQTVIRDSPRFPHR